MKVKDSSHCRKSNQQAEIANWIRRVATVTINPYYRCTSSDTNTEQARVMEKIACLELWELFGFPGRAKTEHVRRRVGRTAFRKKTGDR